MLCWKASKSKLSPLRLESCSARADAHRRNQKNARNHRRTRSSPAANKKISPQRHEATKIHTGNNVVDLCVLRVAFENTLSGG